MPNHACLAFIDAHWDAGSFSSPLNSFAYHWRRHSEPGANAPPADTGDTLESHTHDALERTRDYGITAPGRRFGRVMTASGKIGKFLSDERTWVLWIEIGDGPDARKKIISFRDRAKVGRDNPGAQKFRR
jgi:hypothetical protein